MDPQRLIVKHKGHIKVKEYRKPSVQTRNSRVGMQIKNSSYQYYYPAFSHQIWFTKIPKTTLNLKTGEVCILQCQVMTLPLAHAITSTMILSSNCTSLNMSFIEQPSHCIEATTSHEVTYFYLEQLYHLTKYQPPNFCRSLAPVGQPIK